MSCNAGTIRFRRAPLPRSGGGGQQKVPRLLNDAVTTGDYRDLPDTLDAMVKAIGPGLSWETAPGVSARHQFCVSGRGDPRTAGPGRTVAAGRTPAHAEVGIRWQPDSADPACSPSPSKLPGRQSTLA